MENKEALQQTVHSMRIEMQALNHHQELLWKKTVEVQAEISKVEKRIQELKKQFKHVAPLLMMEKP